MSKITLIDFWQSQKELGIHCKTVEEAQKICEATKKISLTNRRPWLIAYPDYKDWYTCPKNAYIENDGMFNCSTYGLEQVYEFDDIIFEKEKQINENVKKVFEILGVEPYEEFKIREKNTSYVGERLYYITENLIICNRVNPVPDNWLQRIIIGELQIIKLPKNI